MSDLWERLSTQVSFQLKLQTLRWLVIFTTTPRTHVQHVWECAVMFFVWLRCAGHAVTHAYKNPHYRPRPPFLWHPSPSPLQNTKTRKQTERQRDRQTDRHTHTHTHTHTRARARARTHAHTDHDSQGSCSARGCPPQSSVQLRHAGRIVAHVHGVPHRLPPPRAERAAACLTTWSASCNSCAAMTRSRCHWWRHCAEGGVPPTRCDGRQGQGSGGAGGGGWGWEGKEASVCGALGRCSSRSWSAFPVAINISNELLIVCF